MPEADKPDKNGLSICHGKLGVSSPVMTSAGMAWRTAATAEHNSDGAWRRGGQGSGVAGRAWAQGAALAHGEEGGMRWKKVNFEKI